jgi:hypothetical protein
MLLKQRCALWGSLNGASVSASSLGRTAHSRASVKSWGHCGRADPNDADRVPACAMWRVLGSFKTQALDWDL